MSCRIHFLDIVAAHFVQDLLELSKTMDFEREDLTPLTIKAKVKVLEVPNGKTLCGRLSPRLSTSRKQEEFIGRLFESVRNNLYAFMLSITSVDAMKVKRPGVEHELTILHHQMWETVREAMKPGLYFIADCQ